MIILPVFADNLSGSPREEYCPTPLSDEVAAMACRWTTVLVLLVCAAVSLASGEKKDPPRSGGRFDTLRPEQQRLVTRWVGEYMRITGKSLTPAESYDKMSASTRATFEAVTHALLNTTLTAQDGSSLGTGLDLVQLVEAVQGQIPGLRGDRQFRLYVLLEPDALDRLSRSQQFKRTHDNAVYHVGYPICYRQRGGAPSLQVSVTSTGRRADIDIDYRSTHPPFVLFNGHLRSSNSDVRVDRNFDRFVRRWGEIGDWWHDLIGRLALPQFEGTIRLSFGVEIPAKPRIRSDRPVSEAAFDFYRKWLVDGVPEQAMAYVSVRSYACLPEYGTGESLDSELAALRILEHMRRGLTAYGRSADLSEAIQRVALNQSGSSPVPHAHRALFTVHQLTDTAARAMDCVERQRVTLAEPLPFGGDELGGYYAVSTRLLRESGAQPVLTQLWTKEGGAWKVVSWYFENPVVGVDAPGGQGVGLRRKDLPSR
jgi:hypothetical protein